MSPEARALQALVHALVERDGAARTREIMADAAGLAMRPPTSDASPEAWHSGGQIQRYARGHSPRRRRAA